MRVPLFIIHFNGIGLSPINHPAMGVNPHIVSSKLVEVQGFTSISQAWSSDDRRDTSSPLSLEEVRA